MSWLPIVLFCLPLIFTGLVAWRLIGVIRMFQDPETLRSLLSERARAALAEAGLDPDTVTMAEIQGRPELQAVVGAELRAVLRGAVFGRAPQTPAAGGVAALRSGFGSPGALRDLPQPIGASAGGQRLRLVLALVLVGLGALAFVLVDILR